MTTKFMLRLKYQGLIRRGILVFLFIFFLLSLTLPYLIGYIAEKSYKNVLKHYEMWLHEQLGADAKFEISSIKYLRGWFSSKAEVHVAIKLLKIDGSKIKSELPLELKAYSKIHHGPWIVIKQPEGYLNWSLGRAYVMTRAQLESLEKNNSNLKNNIEMLVKSHLDFFGYANHECNIKKINWFPTIDPTVEIEGEGFQMNFSHPLNFKKYKMKGLFKHLQIEDKIAFFFLNIHDLSWERVKETKEKLAQENSIIKFHKLELGADNISKTIQLEKNQWFSETKISQTSNNHQILQDLVLGARLEKIQLKQNEWGPLDLSFIISNLDSKAFYAFQNEMKKAPWHSVWSLIIKYLPQLITQQTKIELDPLKINSKNGDINLAGVVYFRFPFPASINQVKSLSEFISSFNFRLDANENMTLHLFEYGLELIERQNRLREQLQPTDPVGAIMKYSLSSISQQSANELVNSWVKAGLLVKDKQKYYINFNYKNGQFSLNEIKF